MSRVCLRNVFGPSADLSVVTTTDPLGGQLPFLLKALSSYALESQQPVEVVVVEDMKLWPTHEVSRHPGHYPGLCIRLVQYPERRGQLQAILTGISQATGRYVLTIDPDMHRCVGEIPRMLSFMQHGYLLVHGVRSSRPDIGLLRRFGSILANKAVRLVSGVRIRDIGSAVALFHRSALDVLETLMQEGNPRLRLYHVLGDRVGFYPLMEGSIAGVPSQYRLTRLIAHFLALLRDSLVFRMELEHSRRRKRR